MEKNSKILLESAAKNQITFRHLCPGNLKQSKKSAPLMLGRLRVEKEEHFTEEEGMFSSKAFTGLVSERIRLK